MPANADDLVLFARVMEAGSFSAAAERLGQPKSTVSRRIAALEAQLGERLITRSTRQLAITEFGENILEHARRILEENEAASAFALHRQATPRGRLRISLPPDFAERQVVTHFLIEFAERYPEISLEIDVSARRVDLLSENFDLAIRVAPQLPNDATLVARRLTELPRGLYASPAYLAHHGRPSHPRELEHGHVGLKLVASNGEPMRWKLWRQNESWEGSLPGPISSNAMGLSVQLASHGLGIASFTERFIEDALADKRLERVLPDWQQDPITLWAVLPGRRLMPQRSRIFVDALREALVGCETGKSGAKA